MSEIERGRQTAQSAEPDKSLYAVISQIRQKQRKPVSRILLAGYVNEMVMQREKIDIQPYITESIKPFLSQIRGLLLVKGLFYLHLIESEDPERLNHYMKVIHSMHIKLPTLHNNINILYNSDENPDKFFDNWSCQNVFQTGPNLGETDKLDQQISDRCFEIYTALGEGARKKLDKPALKIANYCPINVDDMMMLISKRFMSIEEYHALYLTEVEMVSDAQEVFPLRPPLLKNLEFLEAEDYSSYRN